MKKLWQKNWELDSFVESFETKGDLLLDQKLIEFDVYGSIAHAKMLAKMGILSQKELANTLTGLSKILDLARTNGFMLESGDEDIHTKVENFLTENYGEVGKKIHTGRSRNDQVLTDLRLFTKEQLLYLQKQLLSALESFYDFAKKYEFIPMPGYTHTQKAMPSTVGMWTASFIESFLDDWNLVEQAYVLNDQSPLGSAAGYGVPLNLDRDYTAHLLGFATVQANSLYCQNSRGKVEAAVIAALISVLSTINKFSTDILFFTSSELGYFDVSQKLCSGSSIMPQKKNVDIAELLRSKVHLVLGHYLQIVSLSNNLISGYHRDFQDSKKPLIESLEITQDSLKAIDVLIQNLKPNAEKLEQSLTPETFAAHRAFELVAHGVPFREAYQTVARDIPSLLVDIDEMLKQSSHKGGTGNLGLAGLEKKIHSKKQIYKNRNQNYHKAIKNLLLK